MSSSNHSENLISIEEVISRSVRKGVDFGKGNPKERLRYLTKIGLLPHAKRKSFNGGHPNGAYPAWVVELLLEIDKKIKAGKSIQEIKRSGREIAVFEPVLSSSDMAMLAERVKEENSQSEYFNEVNETKVRAGRRLAILLKVFLLSLILANAFFFFGTQTIIKEDISSYLAASLQGFQRLAQVLPSSAPGQDEEVFEASFSLPAMSEPYLTINAQTDINGPLSIKDTITINLAESDFSGTLSLSSLSGQRTYTFPDASGIVCLSSGNCVDLTTGIASAGGVPNRLAKFISETEIGASSIEDLFGGAVALTVDSLGRVGIGTRTPAYLLHVAGRIQANGDICTNLAGGRCLSTLPLGGAPAPSAAPAPAITAGVEGSGTANYLPIWTGGSILGDSAIFQSNGNIGIGNASPLATLTLSGNAVFATTTLPQFVLKYDNDNYLNFAIDSQQSLLEASKKLVFNSLTGEIKLGSNINLFDGFGATVQASTFISTTTDSTVRKSGEQVFRASLPIFRYPVPAQTTSTFPVIVSKTFSASDSLISLTPSQLPGANRTYAFLINFADDIASLASSTWRVFRPSAGTEYTSFEFAGQNLASLEIGSPHLSATTTLPDNDWRLEVSSPSPDKSIRIFNIFLLVFDEIE